MRTRKAVGALAEDRLLLLPLFPMNRPISYRIAMLCGAAVALCLPACKRPEIRVYTILKHAPEASPVPSEAPLQLSDAKAKHLRPKLDYQLPAGWKDLGPNQFSLVNFSIATPKGEATVNITPLSGMDGKDAMIVNMWRSQVGQPPLDDAEAEKSLSPVEIGGESGRLFEVTGAHEGGQPLEIITAFVHRPDGSWFYKLQGSAEAVASQKEAFVNFLKTVKVKPGTEETAETAPTAPPRSLEKNPAEPGTPVTHMVAPEGWKEQAPGQMQVAKFTVEKDGGHAEVSVSIFDSDTGGTLGNVNRWRRMLGLGDVDENGLQECVTTLGGAHFDGAPGPILADLTNENRRLLGAIVPREGKWWFYKMVGDAPVVNAEHDAFVQFVKNQP